MRRRPLAFTSFIVFCVFYLAGCSSGQRDHSPGETIVGKNSKLRSDWINANDTLGNNNSSDDFVVLGDFSTGLEGRDRDFSRAAQSEGFARHNVYESIFFDFDRYNIRADQRDKLAAFNRYLLDNPHIKVIIEGHCDYYGTKEYNLALGERRANSVKNYLIELGVVGFRIETLSKGDLEAVVNGSNEQRANDRRDDLIIVNP